MWRNLPPSCHLLPLISDERSHIRRTITPVHSLLFLLLSHFHQVQVLLWLETQSMRRTRLGNQLPWGRKIRESQDLWSLESRKLATFEGKSFQLEHQLVALAQEMHLWAGSIQKQRHQSGLHIRHKFILAWILWRLLLVIFVLVLANKLGRESVQIHPKQSKTPNHNILYKVGQTGICNFVGRSELVVFTQWTLFPDFGQHNWMVNSETGVLCAAFVNCFGNILFWEGGQEVKTTKSKDRFGRGYDYRRGRVKIYQSRCLYLLILI